MSLKEILNLVWINIVENKFKVILTSLGIIVGAATIVIVIAIGLGGQRDVQEEFKNLNAGTVTISDNSNSSRSGSFSGGASPNFMKSGSQGGSRSNNRTGLSGSRNMPSGMMGGFPGAMPNTQQIKKTTFTNTDLEEITYFVDNISQIALMAKGSSTIQGGTLEDDLTTTIVGATEEYLEISNLNLLIGSFFDSISDEEKERVAVLGYDAALNIFGNIFDAYGSQININSKKYSVIGVLEQTGSVVSEITLDSAVYIPYQTAEKYVLGTNSSPQIVVLVDDVNKIETTIASLQQLLSEMYPTGNISVTDAGSQVAASQKSANTLSILLISVATVVFIVGGIGIMNVLFVSVKERTKEIGILKALGSSRKDILLQFLLEAMLISIFGGIVGVIVGYLLMPLVRLTGMSVIASTSGSIMALIFAIITGTIFGFYPAWQAANLKPIEALNYE
ncbi:MAG: ABC transporter permease [Peptococcaceae bacterium]|nr:ABC transporter permease [Peptococcaceae bacterium]